MLSAIRSMTQKARVRTRVLSSVNSATNAYCTSIAAAKFRTSDRKNSSPVAEQYPRQSLATRQPRRPSQCSLSSCSASLVTNEQGPCLQNANCAPLTAHSKEVVLPQNDGTFLMVDEHFKMHWRSTIRNRWLESQLKGYRRKNMSRNPYLSILLTAALIAQSVIAGWGHSHAHVASGSHSHPDVASHAHHHHGVNANEHPAIPNRPVHSDDCTVCRHLALAAILTLELQANSSGDVVEFLQSGEFSPVSTLAIGLRRPRSPPELS